jgi:VIT1/CCC1 family predicted Fe2+/Mn2+ transporter
MLFKSPTEYAVYVRNFIFGVEDSLVSTVGLLSGIAAADASRGTIVLTGVVLIFVEAFSMGVGSYLSENSTTNFEDLTTNRRTPIIGGVIMLFSYLVAGLVPLLPYIIIHQQSAFWWSIGCSLAGLLVLGIISGRMFGARGASKGLRMFLLGGLAIAIGVAAGKIVANL